ncbi:DUF485 domain-containing protein [Actinokineospora globicatena]|uniref:DUF485 domain-containing protein n=1 Tax=Actinokineospora globicatena TaxID=103729 RepID=A0A9W6V9B3_9PSEU|nr:DUF485 domain-containing protein [Actinokineospora globicatena]MCP2304442.1 Uncharacterized membrane protein, DUF485 family [Actinokineospora globicatena]GLW78192.1 hypothetical protein Aglo01_26740 [Actinokineospora globicatena]GLW85142.1 hypothetical protein Aglo02_27820 [Actinokineospora globicatena]GLW90798.1 hypothetical protein Aglo03_16140 [Actinokineospora globicatena]
MTEVVGRRAASTQAPPRPSATFGGIDGPTGDAPAGGPDFDAIHRSPEFTALRSRFRRFVFTLTGLFLAWYLGYVLLAAYAHEFMATKLVGSISVGLALGLGQFASTVLITAVYARWARRRVDPAVDVLHKRAEAGR